ncbi:MAG: TIR domain-containing protein [Parabacteroides sp.]|nr:TIR domain-containing protein [Parabacteroides sp.]
MTNYVPPLSVIFVWHPADTATIEPIIRHCSSLLSRDINKPFSRSMNLPIFYCTTTGKGVPAQFNILSTKTVIVIFAGENLVANDNWVTYIEKIPASENINIIPIALDVTPFNIKGSLDQKNWIRAYDFESQYLKDYIFISVTHEIYRYSLNDSLKEILVGKDKALNIFLSHAKDGKNGIKLTKALKEFIDNSTMDNFFDATDIAPGYEFSEEIIEHIKESSIIAIHSDSYSSRYWCQREILSAKEYNRPIVAVDSIEEFEDRRFPFASNVPCVYVHLDDKPTEKDLLRILSSTLLETVRFFYSKLLLKQFREAGWIESDAELLSRPPEVSDIDKIFVDIGDSISRKHKSLVYPEPPLYSEELDFLIKLGIQVDTPLTCNVCSLQDKRIGISISDPDEEELIAIGQNKSHLIQVSQDLARHLLIRGATLIYGGDLREDGFTKFIFSEAHTLQARSRSQSIHLKNYIAWPIYKNDSDNVKHWKAKCRPIANMIEIPPPIDVTDLIPNEDMPADNAQNLFVWSRCLTEMRYKMIDNCDIRICAGGRHLGYKGKLPGVLEEILIALEMGKTIFLLGGFGGVTASVCKLIQTREIPKELTVEWQIQNNPVYKEMLDVCLSRDAQYAANYELLVEYLKCADLKNGLSKEDNDKLFNTTFMEEALYLVFKGLNSIWGS